MSVLLCRGLTDFTQGPSPFLRLPAEIRNTIYLDLIRWHHDEHDTSQLEEQPAITRVCRQLRAEALPLWPGAMVNLIKTRSSRDWVPYIQRFVDAFTGGADGLPGSSTLRLLEHVELDFMTPFGIHIEVDLVTDPEDTTVFDPVDRDKRVIVGSPGLDWTDAEAVRAACDEAACELADNLRGRPLRDDLGLVLVQTSDVRDHKAVLDCVRMFTLACPQLTSVCIYDSSHPHRVEASILEFLSYESLRERLFTDVEV